MQCDKIARLLVRYFALYNNKNLPKYVQNFAKYKTEIYNFAKATKFRQIWLNQFNLQFVSFKLIGTNANYGDFSYCKVLHFQT